jgi:hypothetical protein
VCGSKCYDCKKDKTKRHGPYYLWTRKDNGKTKSKYLFEKQAAACRKFIKNHEKLIKIIDEMKRLSEKAIDNTK